MCDFFLRYFYIIFIIVLMLKIKLCVPGVRIQIARHWSWGSQRAEQDCSKHGTDGWGQPVEPKVHQRNASADQTHCCLQSSGHGRVKCSARYATHRCNSCRHCHPNGESVVEIPLLAAVGNVQNHGGKRKRVDELRKKSFTNERAVVLDVWNNDVLAPLDNHCDDASPKRRGALAK